MATVSLCMIVKNEEETLARCLDSVKECVDEIVIVDTGSTDSTIEIARQYTGNVHEFAWIDDFSAARNHSFSLATMDYILWLDADDVIEPEAADAFSALVRAIDEKIDCVMMRYHIAFDDMDRPTFSYDRERLVRRGAGFRWMEPVHEYIDVSGNIIRSAVAISHRKPLSRNEQPSTRNLDIYERQLKEKGQLSPRGQYYYARELKDHGRHRAAASAFELFLRGGKGWVEDNIQACLAMGACHQALREDDAALLALVRSFTFDTPRAEVCCRIGYIYKARADYRRALFWFGLAERAPRPEVTSGFMQEDDWGFVPALESCVCHYGLGDIASARAANERAALFKPENGIVKRNRALLTETPSADH